VLKALLAAYPDRLAVRRQSGKPTGLMVGGRGVKLAPSSVVHDADLFLCIDVDDTAANALVRLSSAVDREWLDENFIEQRDEVFFHPSQKQLMGRRRTYWDDLIIEESPIPVPASNDAADTLFRAAAADWDRVFPADDRELNSFIARVNFLQKHCPDLGLPSLNREDLEHVMRDLCRSCRSFDDLRRSDWLGCLRARFDYPQLQQIEEYTPQKWKTPNGKQIRIEYETGQTPVLAVRIQDMFGQRDTPRIAGGRVPLVLHLLAPNMRPQQVTDDLASFWQNTYAQVRKDLRRRYSKHAWPEDPLSPQNDA
jgi:ATP-dependent helicase HrpB